MHTSPSEELMVQEYRSILIWPLRVDYPELEGKKEYLSHTFTRFLRDIEKDKKNWTPVASPLHHLNPGDAEDHMNEDMYEEFVYFHPFIQRYLYGEKKARDAQLKIYRHNIASCDMRWTTENGDGTTVDYCHRFEVERCNLYAFKQGIAVLVVELKYAERHLNLADALVINSRLRHAYKPYKINSNASGCTLDWQGKAKTVETDRDGLIKQVTANRRSPIASHWQHVLPKLSQGDWHHVMDDRIPAMTFLTLNDPTRISPEDWARIAFHETPGSGWPYAKQTFKTFDQDHAYDLFWEPGTWKSTRYLFSATGMAAVTQHNEHFTPILRKHFRRHYFQMGLICQMQIGALFALSDRMSSALSNGILPEERTRVQQLLEDVLKFTHTWWFPEISHHSQAKAMFAKWRAQIGVEELYSQVIEEAKEANALLNQKEDRRAADNTDRINVLVAVGMVIASVTGFFGMNILIEHDTYSDWLRWSYVAFALGASSAAFAAITFLNRWHTRRESPGWVSLPGMMLGMSVLFFLAWYLLGKMAA